MVVIDAAYDECDSPSISRSTKMSSGAANSPNIVILFALQNEKRKGGEIALQLRSSDGWSALVKYFHKPKA